MKNKIVFSTAITIIFIVLASYYFLNKNHVKKESTNTATVVRKGFLDENGISYNFKLEGKYFYSYENNSWRKEFIKGVNIGAAKPGYFPGEFGVTKEDYMRWFKYISHMNGNSIRVYTILMPAFYEALYEYNSTAEKPLYLFQGVWINEEDIANLNNAYDSKIYEQFKEDIKTTIDLIHGNKYINKKPGHAGGNYIKDVSPYVAGWILGIEWDPDFVENTDKINSDKIKYEGKYLYTEKASPFENFLAEIGDFTIDYEREKYKSESPLSFTNWLTTDMLSHPNEPMDNEDRVTVNTEHIKTRDNFKAGFFASYHIYPYYPDFMNFQKEYREFKDKDGKINTYRAYLKDLIKEHTTPVLVAEFGVPAARGKAHDSVHMGFNQGNISETDQGKMDAFMLENIFEEGYAGGLIFAWQDEWFKRTWNTMDFDIADRRPYWSNDQTNEQQFGLLAFDPGKDKSKCYVDGDISDWKEDKPLKTSDNMDLYAKSDEKYLYLMINGKNKSFQQEKLIIPLDVIPNQGNSSFTKALFNREADFIVLIQGKENSKILVDAYYDSFYYTYAKQLSMIEKNQLFEKKNSGIFNPIYLCLNKELYLPQDNIKLPLSKYETGALKFGNGNPNHKDYDSLTDFNINNNIIELRIPWQLINMMDPSTRMAMEDLYIEGIKPKEISGIHVGAALLKEEGMEPIDFGFYTWDKWEEPTYHERLKPSYYILKEAFKNIGF